MRRLGGLVIAALTAWGALYACGGEEEPPAAVGPEAALPDASILQDTSTPDVIADAAAPVTVVVERAGTPSAGVLVVFHGANGSILETTKTGFDGRATSHGVVPAQVTALLDADLGPRALTWVDVAAGDELHASQSIGRPPPLGTHLVSLPNAPDSGASTYVVKVGGRCERLGTPALPVEIKVTSDCAPAPTISVLARAAGQPSWLAFKKGTPRIDDGGVVSVKLSPWAVPSSIAVTQTGAAASGEPSAILTELSEGAAFSEKVAFDAGGAMFESAPGFADSRQIFGSVRALPSTGYSFRTITKRAGLVSSFALDFDATLPAIREVSLDRSDVARPTLTWTPAASLASSDGGFVTIGWVDAQGKQHSWSFVVPASATSLKVPALPPDGSAWVPPAGDGGSESPGAPSVVFVESDAVASPAAFRRDAAQLLSLEQYRPGLARVSGAVVAPNTTLRATVFDLLGMPTGNINVANTYASPNGATFAAAPGGGTFISGYTTFNHPVIVPTPQPVVPSEDYTLIATVRAVDDGEFGILTRLQPDGSAVLLGAKLGATHVPFLGTFAPADYNPAVLAEGAPYAFTQNAQYVLALRAAGNHVYGKIWESSKPEPANWDVDAVAPWATGKGVGFYTYLSSGAALENMVITVP